jgi:translation initiation factor IF-3
MIIKRRHFVRPQDRVRVVANHQIRFPQVRVLDEFGEVVGIMSSQDAQNRAREAGKDLVLVTEHAEVPIVKVIALSKFRYQLQQKQAESRKKSRAQDTKEIRFRSPYIGEGDLQVRLKKITEFLKKGDKVRLTLEFKGRDITKQDLARNLFKRIFQEIEEIGSIEIEPRMMGKKLFAQVMPGKKAKPKEEKHVVAPSTPVAVPTQVEENHATVQTENA